MRTVRLRAIPRAEAEGRTVFQGDIGSRERDRAAEHAGAALLTDNGGTDYACGACGRPVLARVAAGFAGTVVLRCPACGVYNEVP